MTPPTGTVTFALTDIEGSTALWERLGDAFRPVLERHNHLLRAAIAAHGGFEFRTEGDAFCVAFATARGAAGFAVASQVALAAEPWPAAVGDLRVRIGLHTGEPILVAGAGGTVDYVGQATARAQAVAAAAHGGQIVLSDAARANLDAPPGSVLDLGHHRVRGVDTPVRLWQLTPASQTGRSFPPPRTLTASDVHLPIQNTSFVGRARELEEIETLLAGGTGLLTLTGPGGTGKTRLALRAAARLATRYPGGVWAVDCASAKSEADVAAALAGALGSVIPPGQAPGAAAAALLELRPPLLLVLDSFEQAAAAAPATLALWRRRAPHAVCLVTSTRLLGIAGEHEYPVPSLDAGGPDSDAVRLFVERAREADPRFTPGPDTLPDLVAIAADLDGLPLALELAAARIRVLRPAQLRQKLGQRFQILRSARTDLPPRERTLEGALEWSWAMLADWERSAFEQLTVFPAGFSLDAAEQVLDLSGFPEAPLAMDAVQQLREKSFLRTVESPTETRFAMYRSLREFGGARLRASGGDRGAALRLAAWAEAFVAREAPAAAGRTPREALARFSAESANLAAAVSGLPAAGEPRRAGLLLRDLHAPRESLGAAYPASFYRTAIEALPETEPALRSVLQSLECHILRGRGEHLLAESRSDQAVRDAEAARDGAALARALHSRGASRDHLGNAAGAEADLRRAVALAQEAGDPRLILRTRLGLLDFVGSRQDVGAALREGIALAAFARDLGDLDYLAWILDALAPRLFQSGDVAGAIRTAEECEATARGMGGSKWLAKSVARIGHYLAQTGQTARALERLQEAEALLRRAGLRLDLAFVVRIRGNLHRRLGQFEEALRCYDEAEPMERAVNNATGLGSLLRSRGHLHTQRGETDAAERAYGEALDIARKLGDKPDILRGCFDLANVARSRGDAAGLLRIFEQAEVLAREIGYPEDLTGALGGRAEALSALGRGLEGLPLLDEALTLVRSLDLPITQGNTHFHRAVVFGRLLRWPDARAAALEALACYRRGGSETRRAAIEMYRVIAEAEEAAGNLDEAHAAVGSGSALVTALGLDRVSGAPDVAAFQAVRRRLLR